MRKHLVGAAIGAIAMVGTVVVAGNVAAGADGTGGKSFRLALSGAQEFSATGAPINPHGNADRGTATLTLNQGQGRICWSFGAITLTAGEALPHVAHIHKAPPGLAGPVVVDIFGGNAPVPAPTAYPTGTSCVSASRDVVKDIRKNPEDYYLNLHNAQHPEYQDLLAA